ncbi:MAG: tyrosine-type recombinase/integrase [Acidimicrobiia bacterium]
MSIHKRDTTRGTRYDVRLRTADGKPYKRTFRTKDEARAWERSELTARDRGDWADPSARRRTYAEVAVEWMASNPAKRASTRGRDRSALERHVLPHLGDKRIGSIVPADVQALVAKMSATLGAATVVRNYNVAAAVFRYATDRDYIAKSPCRTVKLPRIPRTKVHVFSPEQLAALADAMPAEHAPMVWIGALLGLRWGEVAALAVADLDLLGRTLTVRRTVTRDDTGATSLGEPKSEAGRRTLTIPAPLGEVLSAHLATRGLTAADGDALLFPGPRGRPQIASNWRRRVWLPAIIKIGLGTIDEKGHYEGPTFHDLRRTSATGLVAAGVDVKTAQTRLGHSQVRLTLELYAQAVDEQDVKASDALAARLMPSRTA